MMRRNSLALTRAVVADVVLRFDGAWMRMVVVLTARATLALLVARLTFARFADAQQAAIDFVTIVRFYGLAGFLFAAHGDKGKAAGLLGLTVGNDEYIVDS